MSTKSGKPLYLDNNNYIYSAEKGLIEVINMSPIIDSEKDWLEKAAHNVLLTLDAEGLIPNDNLRTVQQQNNVEELIRESILAIFGTTTLLELIRSIRRG